MKNTRKNIESLSLEEMKKINGGNGRRSLQFVYEKKDFPNEIIGVINPYLVSDYKPVGNVGR